MFKSMKKKFAIVMSVVAMLAMGAQSAFAVGISLLDATAKTTIQGFGDNLMPTVLELLGIIIPVGLALWALGLGVKKGIHYLQARASKAI